MLACELLLLLQLMAGKKLRITVFVDKHFVAAVKMMLDPAPTRSAAPTPVATVRLKLLLLLKAHIGGVLFHPSVTTITEGGVGGGGGGGGHDRCTCGMSADCGLWHGQSAAAAAAANIQGLVLLPFR